MAPVNTNTRRTNSGGGMFSPSRGAAAWSQSISGLAMMMLAQQALSKMQDKGVTPAQVLNKLAAKDLAPRASSVQTLPTDSQAQYTNDQGGATDQDELMVKDLLDSIARDAMALQGGQFQQDAQFVDLMAPAYLQSMGLNFEMIQQSADRVLLAQASSPTATASGSGSSSATSAAATSAGEAVFAGMSPPMLLGVAVLGALALASGGSSSAVAAVLATAKGKVVDGYVKGATVFADLNNDGLKGSDEPSAVTDATGGYSLSSTASLANANIISLGGTDTQTGSVVNMMIAPAGLAVVSPSQPCTPWLTVLALELRLKRRLLLRLC